VGNIKIRFRLHEYNYYLSLTPVSKPQPGIVNLGERASFGS